MAGFLLLTDGLTPSALAATPEQAQVAEASSVDEFIEEVIRQEDRNYEIAKHWQYDQHIVAQKLDSKGKVKSEKSHVKASTPAGRLSFSVNASEEEKEDSKVDFGIGHSMSKPEGGKFSESSTMRELMPFYNFTFAGEEDLDGRKVRLVDFEPKPKKELPKAENRQQRVLMNLHGRLWIDATSKIIRRAECSLVRPMPFAWFDLVSLRDLKIRYETILHEGKVWLPKGFEVEYLVRIVYFTHIRERQTMTAEGYHQAPVEPAETEKPPADSLPAKTESE